MRRATVVFLALAALITVANPGHAGVRGRARASGHEATTKPFVGRAKPARRRALRSNRRSHVVRPRLRRAQNARTALRSQRVHQRRGRGKGVGKGLVLHAAGRPLHDVDLIIFDLDGTLAETRKDIAINFDAGFRNIGLEVPMDKLIELVDGSPLHKTYEAMKPNGNKAELQKFLDGFLASQKKRGPNGHTYEEIEGLLRVLSKRPGIKLAVATARPPENAAKLLNHLGIRRHFDLVTGTSGTQMPHKPAPDLLLYAAARLGVDPVRTVMVGDTYSDILAGKRAGMGTIAMTYGMGDPARVAKQNPDVTARDVRSLYKAFGIDRRSGKPWRTASELPPRLIPSRDVRAAESRSLLVPYAEVN